MADKVEPVASDELAEGPLEELLPGRTALLRELGRSLRAESPAWAEALIRELELLLQPNMMTGMHRRRMSCGCGEAMLCRFGEPIPHRPDGPAVLAEVQRTLAITHAEKSPELVDELRNLASMPVAASPDATVTAVCPSCGERSRVIEEFYCPPCGMG